MTFIPVIRCIVLQTENVLITAREEFTKLKKGIGDDTKKIENYVCSLATCRRNKLIGNFFLFENVVSNVIAGDSSTC